MDWYKILESLLYVVFTVTVPVLVKEAVTYFRARGKEATVKVENETAQKYLDFALDAVIDSVTYVTQTFVDSLKKAGEFNKETGEEAYNKAKERALELMSKETKEFIQMTYGDINVWLQTQIEAQVYFQKTDVIVSTGLEIIE